jgi:hypothetical protein
MYPDDQPMLGPSESYERSPQQWTALQIERSPRLFPLQPGKLYRFVAVSSG